MLTPEPGSQISSNEAGRFRLNQFSSTLIVLLITISIFILYANTLFSPFVFDDVPELLHNPDVLSFGGCLDTITRSSNTGLSGRPVACLSFAANVITGRFSVLGFHLANITIHVLAACTLFGILRRTLDRMNPSMSYSSTAAAGVIAALWAVHPLQTESVTYVIQRIESLAGLWYLLTLYCAIRSWNSGRTILWGGLSVLCCALGMLTKEIVVTAPLIVLLYERVFMHTANGGVPRRRIRLHLALAATWIIPIALNINSPRGGSAGFGLGVSALDYLRTQAEVIVYYLRLSFWPFPQAISYSDWPIVREWMPSLAPGLILLTLLAISVIGVVKRKWWGFCGAWFFFILAPSSSFIPIVTEPAAERRMYLPLAGLITVSVFLVQYVLCAVPMSSRARKLATATFSIAAVCLLSAATVARNAQYATAVNILTSTQMARPGDELVRGALVEELVREDRLDEAGRIQEEGIARNPHSYILYDNWARTMSSINRHDEAIRAYAAALEIRPDHHPSRAGLGLSLMQSGRYADALVQLRNAVRLAPESFTIHGNLAVALANLGRTQEAITELQTAIALKPRYVEGHYNLARLFAADGRNREALEHFRIAAALRPDDSEFQNALAQAIRKAAPPRATTP